MVEVMKSKIFESKNNILSICLAVGTHFIHDTRIMLWILGTTYFSTEKGDCHPEFTPDFRINGFHQLFFNLLWISTRCDPNSRSDTHNMEVNNNSLSRHAGFTHDNTGRLSTNA